MSMGSRHAFAGGFVAERALREHLAVLERLQFEGILDGVTVYPASGVDALVSLFADRVLSINLRAYTVIEMIEEMLPTVGVELAARIERHADRIESLSGVDVTDWEVFSRALGKYRHTRQTVYLKGFFDSAFLREWDRDAERFYPVPESSARLAADVWLQRLTATLKTGDRVVCFDEELRPVLERDEGLTCYRDIRIGLDAPDIVRRDGVAVLYLGNHAAVFEKRSL
jgi:hypothetical protein